MGFLDHKRFFVFGMARSGRAVATLLAERGYEVVVHDDVPAAVAAWVESDDFAGNDACRARVTAADDWRAQLDRCGCLVLSPGVPLDHTLVVHARGRNMPVVGEIEAAYHFNKALVVGVTGTNGKSTVVGVIGKILEQAGVRAVVAGNIGNPFADAVRAGGFDTIVLELSSFQLDTIDEFRVDVAVLLNVTPDHLDRYHHSFDEYAASKARILNHAQGETFYVYNGDDAVAAQLAADYAGPSMEFSSTRRVEYGLYAEDGMIRRRGDDGVEDILPRSEFSPVGVHNLENAMAAIAATTPFELRLDDVRAALRAYRALPHRMELVRVVGGIAYVNDSKATNVDAAVKSLMGIEGGVVIILGGRDKDGDFTALKPYLARVRLAVLIGEARAVIRAALEGHCVVADADDMAGAVAAAAAVAQAGDTVLLAPACASFDMFDNYQHRGEVFRKVVNAL